MEREGGYDPRIIEQFAAKLYGKSSAVVAGGIVTGAIVGAGFGAVPLTSLGENWPIPSTFGFATTLLGLLVGALVGYVVGDARSFGYRLQAQVALCQLQTERNTAKIAAVATGQYQRQTTPAAQRAQPAAPPPPVSGTQPVSATQPVAPAPAVAPAPPVAPAPAFAPPPVTPPPVAAAPPDQRLAG
jgi:hypothetical protein